MDGWMNNHSVYEGSTLYVIQIEVAFLFLTYGRLKVNRGLRACGYGYQYDPFGGYNRST